MANLIGRTIFVSGVSFSFCFFFLSPSVVLTGDTNRTHFQWKAKPQHQHHICTWRQTGQKKQFTHKQVFRSLSTHWVEKQENKARIVVMNSLKLEGILYLNLHSTGMNELDNNFPLQSHQNVPRCFSSARGTLVLCFYSKGGFVDNEHFHCGELILTEISAAFELPSSHPYRETWKCEHLRLHWKVSNTHKKNTCIHIYRNIFPISITCKNVAIWKNVKSEPHLQAIRFNWTAELYFIQSVYNVLTHLSKIFLPAKHYIHLVGSSSDCCMLIKVYTLFKSEFCWTTSLLLDQPSHMRFISWLDKCWLAQRWAN